MNREQIRDRYFLPIILLMLIIAVGTSFYGLKSVNDTSNDLAREFLQRTSNSINNDIKAFLYPALNANSFFDDFLKSYPEKAYDYETLEKLGVEVLQHYPSLRAFNVGYENGDFFMIKKNQDDTISIKIIYRNSEKPYSVWKHYNSELDLIEESNLPVDEYDPRLRAWYIGAKIKKSVYWTSIYTFFTDKDLGVTVGTPILNEQKVVGVFSFDFKLKGISDYISILNVSENGEAIIVNSQEDTLTFSSIEETSTENVIRPTRINMLDDEIIQTAYGFAVKQENDVYKYKVDDKWFYTIFSDLVSVKNDNWKIGIIVPETDFLKGYKLARNLIIVVIGIVITLVVLLNYYRYSEKKIKSYLINYAERDTLTGLLNRRSITKLYYKLFSAKMTPLPLTIILSDIDHFKKVNDVYGHNGGDDVLKFVSQLLQNHVREGDLVCRWGGEEFLIVLKNTDATQAIIVAENLRLLLMQSILEVEENKINVTMSFGVSTIYEKMSLDDVVRIADGYLYEAKESGRNRVISS